MFGQNPLPAGAEKQQSPRGRFTPSLRAKRAPFNSLSRLLEAFPGKRAAVFIPAAAKTRGHLLRKRRLARELIRTGARQQRRTHVNALSTRRRRKLLGAATYRMFELFQYTAWRLLPLDRCRLDSARVMRLMESVARAIVPPIPVLPAPRCRSQHPSCQSRPVIKVPRRPQQPPRSGGLLGGAQLKSHCEELPLGIFFPDFPFLCVLFKDRRWQAALG